MPTPCCRCCAWAASPTTAFARSPSTCRGTSWSPLRPLNGRAGDGQGAAIGAAVFEADGFRFERVWGDPGTPWISPAEFVEDITTAEGRRSIHQKIVPYRRQVGPLVETLTLAVERDLASQDRGSVTFMIGYGLARADVEPV